MQQNNQHSQQSVNASMFNIPPPLPPANINYQGIPHGQQLLQPPPHLPYQAPPPLPPTDIEQKNIIEKLANFVARNGPEFENVTKLKQKDNPKFNFLFGGEYFSFYQYRLSVEREAGSGMGVAASASQNRPTYPLDSSQSMMDLSMPPPIPMPIQTDQYVAQIAAMQSKVNEFKDQILQSEKNLKAQNEVFEIKKKIQIEELLKMKKHEKFTSLLRESQLDISSLEQISNKIIESCTKEAIANGRNFVFSKNLNDKQIETICYYLLQRILSKDCTEDARLHLIYFINDIVHNANRKEIEMVKKNIENIIIPSFCFAIEKTDDERKFKMNKLLELWEKNKYFSAAIIEKLKNPAQGVQYHEDMINEENKPSIKQIETEAETLLKNYEKQHKEFVEHSNIQITNLEQQINQTVQQQIKKQQQMNMMIPPPSLMQNQFHQQQMSSPNIPPIMNHPKSFPMMQSQMQNQNMGNNNNSNNTNYNNNGNNNNNNNNTNNNINNSNKFNQINNQQPAKNPPALMSLMSLNPFGPSSNQNQQIPIAPPLMSIPPPSIIHPEGLDLSRPPPGFGPLPPPKASDQSIQLKEIDVPYYNLPASLMLKFIKPETIDYDPLDPKKIKLIVPEPPSERLIKAIEEFYMPASPTKPRNSDGWEKNGLYEFYKMKVKTYLQKKTDKKNKKLEKRKKKAAAHKSRRSSKSKHRSRGSHRRRSYSSSSKRSSSSSRSRSGSRSSRSHSKKYSPPPKSIKRRSITPPYISVSSAVNIEQRIDSSNKGHQLLHKMGYSGGGLGRREQGIVNPIEGGEAREKSDQYRGVGMKSDPFEAFRKNKAQGYIQRLRDRDETRREESMRKSQFSDESKN